MKIRVEIDEDDLVKIEDKYCRDVVSKMKPEWVEIINGKLCLVCTLPDSNYEYFHVELDIEKAIKEAIGMFFEHTQEGLDWHIKMRQKFESITKAIATNEARIKLP